MKKSYKELQTKTNIKGVPWGSPLFNNTLHSIKIDNSLPWGLSK